MIDELPGLLGSGFRPTGKYGIGFFSVFMLGDSVRIRTRRADAAQKDTLVLEFNTGLSSRPVLREAANDEVLRDGGSCIRVWLRTAPTEKGGLLYRFRGDPTISLAQLSREVCPALPVRLVCHEGNTTTPVVTGDDWLDCPGKELFRRTCDWTYDTEDYDGDACQDFIAKAGANLRVLRESDNTAVGRACIGLATRGARNSTSKAGLHGAVTIGGLTACQLRGIVGILAGTSERAARDDATPIVSRPTLCAWATEQASLVAALYEDPEDQMDCAEIVRRCGGETLGLPVARHAGSHVSFDQIACMSLPDEVLIVAPYSVSDLEELRGFEFGPGVFVTEFGGWTNIIRTSHFSGWPYNLVPRWGEGFSVSTTLGGSVVEAVAQGWGSSIEEVARQATDRSKRREERVIGHVNSQEIKRDVLVLNRA